MPQEGIGTPLGVEVGIGKRHHLGPGEDPFALELVKQVIDQVGIRHRVQRGGFVILLELFQHILRVVHEVEYIGTLLARIGAIEPR